MQAPAGAIGVLAQVEGVEIFKGGELLAHSKADLNLIAGMFILPEEAPINNHPAIP